MNRFSAPKLALAAATILGTAWIASPARAEEEINLPKAKWSFAAATGTFDRAALQRGFQVYNEVCSACHSMRHLAYRDLEEIGLSKAQVQAIAATKTVPGELDDDGKPTTRPGRASDHFASPFPNDKAAKSAMNGALPPDQSLLINQREVGSHSKFDIIGEPVSGANYIFDLISKGYVDAPAGVKVPDGAYYNAFFPGHFIHMPPPLAEGAVTYADGTKATVEQEAHDVVTFLYWAANPEMEARKHLGIRVVGFLLLMTGATYMLKKRVWAKVEH
jgi:ubiquinol-cytochrome c reductase cytochrome c1 subunit